MAGDIVRNNQTKKDPDQVLDKITKALEGLKYGEVVIKVQGGKVVFVDRYERERIE
ncbi:YezD family protein [Pelotomaculum propionicicum]|uniref:YezD family protein n=1 Tax=Pelotomaculum propionicicum TaxID=258475 RepID=UPI003B794CD7